MRDEPHVYELLRVGAKLAESGQYQDSVSFIRKAVSLQPDSFEAWALLAGISPYIDLPFGVETAYRRAIILRSFSPELHFNLAIFLGSGQRIEEAIASFLQALKQAPDLNIVHYPLACAYRKIGQYQEAEASFLEAIRVGEDTVDVFLSLSSLHLQLNRQEDAISTIRNGLLIHPADARLHNNLGNLLKQSGDFAGAAYHQRGAICLAPHEGEFYINLSNTHHGQGRSEVALKSCRQGAILLPKNAKIHMNTARVLYSMRRLEEAAHEYDQLITRETDEPEAHWNLGLIHLLQGKFKTGWALYEWRFRHQMLGICKKASGTSEWDGVSSLRGKTILVYAEQGLGDTLQFLRFAMQLHEGGATVILEVQPLLRAFLARAMSFKVIAQNETPPEHDYHFPLMSLPGVLQISESNIPKSDGYLMPDSERLIRWAAALGERTRPRVGLVVSGSPTHARDLDRSISLEVISRYLPEGIDYFLLQKEIRLTDRGVVKDLSDRLIDIGQIGDFEDTAALCSLMDHVVSVDTSVAHLSGAMGKSTQILLSHLPDWRWGLEGAKTPWYSRATLCRQDVTGEWGSVLKRLRRNLGALVSENKAQRVM